MKCLDFLEQIPKKEMQIIQALKKHNAEVFVIGGAVRDFFLKTTPNDFDLVCNLKPEEIIKIIKKELPNFSISEVGKSFGIVIADQIEIASYRKDLYPNGNGASNCLVEFTDSIHTDISRRDFSWNGLCIDPISGKLIDDYNGISDLENRVVKFIGNPDDRISEDPCRIIRSCRLLAKIEGVYDIDTLTSLRKNAHLVANIDAERVQQEILKTMSYKTPSLFFSALFQIGALQYIFPEMVDCVHHTGGNHHSESVFEHLMLSCDSVSPKFPLVRIAAACHDIGKPASHNKETGTFLSHETYSAKIVNKRLKALKFSNHDRETIVNLISVHMLGSGPAMTPRSIRRFQRTLSDLNVYPSDFIRLRISDRLGNIKKNPFSFSDIKFKRSMFNFIESPVFNVNSLALKGGDLIRIFELKPSPVVGNLQKHLLEYVIENGFEFNTEKYLFIEGKKYLDSLS